MSNDLLIKSYVIFIGTTGSTPLRFMKCKFGLSVTNKITILNAVHLKKLKKN